MAHHYDDAEVTRAYQSAKIKLRELIAVRHQGKLIKTTYGRPWFNSVLPPRIEYINQPMAGSKALNDFIVHSLKLPADSKTVKLIDLKDIGFGRLYSYRGFLCQWLIVAIFPGKKIIQTADKRIAEINDNFTMGLISNDERKRLSKYLDEVTEDIAEKPGPP